LTIVNVASIAMVATSMILKGVQIGMGFKQLSVLGELMVRLANTPLDIVTQIQIRNHVFCLAVDIIQGMANVCLSLVKQILYEVAFAEDVFGNQFLFNHSGVVWLEVETGKLRGLCNTFSEWMALIVRDIDFYTGAWLARAWEKSHPDEPLTGMYHLAPLTLFVCGGE